MAPSAALGIAFFAAAALACGGGGVPTGPGRPAPSVDLGKLRTFINDPLVKLLPTLLADRDAAHQVDYSMERLRESVAAGHVAEVSTTLDSVQVKFEVYKTTAVLGAGDPVVLDALHVVLLESRVLLEEVLTAKPAPLALD
jgi:hypothetical protein